MSGQSDSSVDPPRPRGCCRACVSSLCKLAKGLLHFAVVVTVFILIFVGLVGVSFGAKIALESVSFPVIVCLYIYSSSSRKEKIISGIFLGVLALVIVIGAPTSAKRGTAHVAIFVCNFLALLAYCVWRFWALVQACCGRHRVRSAAASPAPLLPVVRQEEAGGRGSPVQVQHAAFRIEELPQEFSHDEIRAVTGDFGSMVGRGGSAEVFRGVLDDGTAVAVKWIVSSKAVVGEADFLREVSIVANVHHRSLVRLLGYCLLRGGGGGDGDGQQYLVLV